MVEFKFKFRTFLDDLPLPQTHSIFTNFLRYRIILIYGKTHTISIDIKVW